MLQSKILNHLRKITFRRIIISKSDSIPQKLSEYGAKYSLIIQNMIDHNEKIWNNSSEYKKEKIKIIINALDDMTEDEKQYLKFLMLRDSFETSINDGLKNSSDNDWKLSIFNKNPNIFENLQDEMTISSFLNASSSTQGGSTQTSSESTETVADEVEEEVVSAKTKFIVKLVEVPAAKKLLTIKEVKSMLGIGLKDAKDMVESLPANLKEDANEEEIQKLKDKFEGLGCTLQVV